MPASGILPLLCTFGVLLLSGCDAFISKGIEVDVRTDKEAYDANATIRLTATNNSDVPVYYLCAGQVTLHELSNGKVVNSWRVNGGESCTERDAIEPGKTFTLPLPLQSKELRERLTAAKFNPSVSYQFDFALFGDLSPGQIGLLSEQNRSSNRFSIVR